LGPKRVKLLYDKLGIRSVEDFRRAIKTHRLRELRGFSAKSEEKLFAALAKPAGEKRFKLAVAEEEAESLVSYLGQDLNKGRVVWWPEAIAGGATRLETWISLSPPGLARLWATG
jgi:DNA polymerase (family 10)